MTGCQHTATTSLALNGPGGATGNADFSGRQTQDLSITWNDFLTWFYDGNYTMLTSTSAYCSCIRQQFMNTGTRSITIHPPPLITSLTNGIYAAFAPYVNTPQSANQYLIIWGSDLTAAGASNPPTVSVNGVSSAGGAISVSGFHLGGGWYVGETMSTGASQINIPYWVDANAAEGTYTISLQTVGGVAQTTFVVSPLTTPTISQNPTQLWYFGPGNTPPPSFSLGDIKTTLTAGGAPIGTYQWSISAGPSKGSFASGSGQASITTGNNSVTLYSIGYSTSAGDVTVALTWTDSAGITHPTASYSLSIDSPFRLSLVQTTSVLYVVNCASLATGSPAWGWAQRYTWRMLSKFGIPIVGQSFNESFANQIPLVAGENWPAFTPNGAVGAYGSSAFNDTYCVMRVPNQLPMNTPAPAISYSGYSLNEVDLGQQFYAVGTDQIGLGIQVQSQVLRRYIENPALESIVSPVRSQ